MTPKITVFALVLAVLALSVHAQDADPEAGAVDVKCRPREKYSECGNSCNEPKCEQNGVQVCPAVCQPGCYCTTGTSRNKFGNCVPSYLCVYKNYIG